VLPTRAATDACTMDSASIFGPTTTGALTAAGAGAAAGAAMPPPPMSIASICCILSCGMTFIALVGGCGTLLCGGATFRLVGGFSGSPITGRVRRLT